MKNLVKAVVVFLMIQLLYAFVPQENQTYSLTVKVKDLRDSKGVVQFALYNKDGTIPDEHFKKYYKISKVAIKNGSAEVTFNDLPQGKYAVNILHDENKNGEIDKGWVLPVEGIGFSNFKSIGFSNRPNFSKASFDLNSDRLIYVKVIYM